MLITSASCSGCQLPKDCSHKSSICGTDQKTGNEDTARDTGSVCPTGDEEINNKENPKSGQCEGTYTHVRCVWTYILT